MRFPLPSRKTTFTVLGLLGLNTAAMWGWALVNVYVAVLGYWPDVVFGVGLVLLNIFLSPISPLAGAHQKLFRGLASLLIAVVALVSGAYLLTPKFPQLYWFAFPFYGVNAILQSSFRQNTFTLSQVIQLTLIYIFSSAALILFSILFRSAFQETQVTRTVQGHARRFARQANKIRISLRWRGSRVIVWSGRIALLLMLLATATVGLTLGANVLEARTTQIQTQTRTFTGPSPLPTVNALLLNEKDGLLLAGTDSGVFRSRDQGLAWEAASAGLTNLTVQALGQDLQRGGLYAGTDNGLFRSQDGGLTWELADISLVGADIKTLFWDLQESRLYAGTTTGVFRLMDDGISWGAVGSLPENRQVKVLFRDSRDGTLYAGTNNSLFCLRKGSANWELASQGMKAQSIFALLLDRQTGNFFAGTAYRLFDSNDGGASWQKVNAGSTFSYGYSLLQNGQDNSLYVGTDLGIFHSADNGATWESVNAELMNYSVYALIQDNRNGRMYAGTSNGVFVSPDNGITWKASDSGLASASVQALGLDPRDGTLYAGVGANAFRSKVNEAEWEAVGIGLNPYLIYSYAVDDNTGTVYAATYTGAFRSRDQGTHWESISPEFNSVVNFLLFDNPTHTLYALVGTRAYRSQDDGETWELIGSDIGYDLLSLAVDHLSGTLYAGTSSGIFRFEQGGTEWEPFSNLLSRIALIATVNNSSSGQVSDIVIDEKSNIFYTSVLGGVLRSRDRGESWEIATPKLKDGLFVLTLVRDAQDGTLYAGTNAGLFRSQDGGDSWQAINTGLTTTIIYAVLPDSKNGTVYVGTPGGSFHSQNGGETWEPISVGLTNASVRAFALENQGSTIYASVDLINQSGGGGFSESGGGVYRSQDKGANWEPVSKGLLGNQVWQLLIARDGSLYARTSYGLLRSRGHDGLWERVNTKPLGEAIVELALDSRDDTLYAFSTDGVFRSRDQGTSWESASQQMFSYLRYALLPPWPLYQSVNDGKPIPFLSVHNLPFPRAEAGQNDSKRIYYEAWGASIQEVQYRVIGSPDTNWWWAWRVFAQDKLGSAFPVALGGIGALLIVWILFTYGIILRALQIATPWKLPLGTAALRSRLESVGASETVQQWQNLVLTELLTFGDALPEDLLAVPAPLRHPLLGTYYQLNQDRVAVQLRGKRLVLLSGAALKSWQTAWRNVTEDFGRRAGLSTRGREQVNFLAKAFSDTLGFSLGGYFEVQNAYAWQVDAPALRLNLPQRFPLVFVADPNPGPETVRLLFDTISILKETSNFTLVIPLEPETPGLDIPFALRRAIDSSPYAHDFVVLGQQDVLEILTARYPERVLVQHVSRQVDLSFISPFVVNGPVPPQMFFGRDNEIRHLVDHAGKRSFAVVGNRKIGKTSLLSRVDARITHQTDVHSVRIDCQAVRESEDFYLQLQDALGHESKELSPAILGTMLRTERQKFNQPLVLILDEIDALLVAEAAHGEPLLAVWRELANERVCSFVFCGSKILAQQLRNPNSALFNFPEVIILSYLTREEMNDVIIRPLEMLGIQMQSQEHILDEIWNLTSGHPNLTQYVGRALVNAANDRRDRLVSNQDVEILWKNSNFAEFYFGTIWGAATPIERMITLLELPADFTVRDVETALKNLGSEISSAQVDAALDMLQVYSIFGRSGRVYHFIPQAFHKLLDLNFGRERLILRVKEQLNQEMRVQAVEQVQVAERVQVALPKKVEKIFHFRGPLGPDSPFYIGREADLEKLMRWCQGEVQHYGIVYGARQSGKSSLLSRLEQRLAATHTVCHLDFEFLSEATPDVVFSELAQEFARAFASSAPDPEVTSALRFTEYLCQLFEAHPGRQVVLLIEELGTLPQKSRLALANTLRAIFTDRFRSNRRALARLMVIVAGTTELYDLANTDVSPFRNICEAHYLVDLSEAESLKLIQDGLSRLDIQPDLIAQIGARIYEFAHGYPYLTQRLGYAVVSAFENGDPLSIDIVDRAVAELITAGDPLVGHLKKALDEQNLTPVAISVLNERVRFNRLDEGPARLELAGFVRPEGGFWQVRNQLFAQAVQSWLADSEKLEQANLYRGLVRIFGQQGYPVGAGFLTKHGQVLTCAHVLATALGVRDGDSLSGTVTLDFPLLSKGQKLNAHIVSVQPYEVGTLSDIAILELDSDAPEGAALLAFAKKSPQWGREFRVCGFPHGREAGAWSTGVLRGPISDGRIQLESTNSTGYAILPGFSGSPVWDEVAEGVIGMIVAADTDMTVKAGFMIPVKALTKFIQQESSN